MPCVRIASGLVVDSSVAAVDSKVECNNRVASVGIDLGEYRNCGRCAIGVAMPCELVASCLGFDAGIAIVDR